jgi:hypothetical protein
MYHQKILEISGYKYFRGDPEKNCVYIFSIEGKIFEVEVNIKNVYAGIFVPVISWWEYNRHKIWRNFWDEIDANNFRFRPPEISEVEIDVGGKIGEDINIRESAYQIWNENGKKYFIRPYCGMIECGNWYVEFMSQNYENLLNIIRNKIEIKSN